MKVAGGEAGVALLEGWMAAASAGAAAGMALLMACRAAKKGLRPPGPDLAS